MQRTVSIFEWLAKAALCLYLGWYTIEIVVCLTFSKHFALLSIPIGVLLVAANGVIATKLIQSLSGFFSTALGLAVTALVVAALAIWIAITVDPNYGFDHAPLLKLSFLLLRHGPWS